MKRKIFLFLSVLFAVSCTDEISFDSSKSVQNSDRCQTANTRLSFSSIEDLLSVIESMGSNDIERPITRTLVSNHRQNNKGFVSYYESRKRDLFATLTKEQIDSIQSDPDSLEFCLDDSIVVDELFAKLLNEDGEIEVNDTIFKYLKNGIARVAIDDYEDLKSKQHELELIDPNGIDVPSEMMVGKVFFNPRKGFDVFDADEGEPETDGGDISGICKMSSGPAYYPTLPLSENNASLTLKTNGVCINSSDIVFGKYNKFGGNGSWIQKVGGLLIGRKCMLNCKFNGHNKVQLNTIEMDYGIYTRLGVEVVKKKKRCGIWWKSHGEEIVLGWNVLELKHELPSLNDTQVPSNLSFYNSEAPAKSWPEALHVFPFQDSNEDFIVLHLPDNDYSLLSSGDINKWFKNGVQSAINSATNEIKNLINGKHDKVGLYYIKDKSLNYAISPTEYHKSNSCFNEAIFNSQWFSGTYMVGYVQNGNSKRVNITVDSDKSTKLNRFVVYGAARHGKTWKACVLTKE